MLQCLPFFSVASKLCHCSHQCWVWQNRNNPLGSPLISQNTGLKVHSFVSILRMKLEYGRFLPSCTMLCQAGGGAQAHKIPKTFLLLSIEFPPAYALVQVLQHLNWSPEFSRKYFGAWSIEGLEFPCLTSWWCFLVHSFLKFYVIFLQSELLALQSIICYNLRISLLISWSRSHVSWILCLPLFWLFPHSFDAFLSGNLLGNGIWVYFSKFLHVWKYLYSTLTSD